MAPHDIIRFGLGDEGLLVPWHAVERGLDLPRARALVQAALGDPASGARLRELAERVTSSVGLDDETIVERLADLLASGSLLVVRLPRQEATWAAPRSVATDDDRGEVRRLSDLREDPTAPFTRPAKTTTWIELFCVGEGGESYAGSQIRLRDPEGGTRALVLDDRSRCRLDDLPSPGTCFIELPTDARTNGIAALQPGGASDPSGRIQPGGPPVGLRTAARHTLVVVQPRTTCVRLVGMLFELNKSFLLPAALEGIRLLAHMYEAMPGAQILVVGHTDRTGKKYRNDSLSLERAEAVIAYMTDDVEGWYAFYTKDTDPSRRWGASEDLAMLSALPRGETPYYSELHEEHDFAAAVRRFQTAKGLTVDGDAGPITRRVLIAEYMALDGTTLPAGTTALAHGCGENFPVVPTDDEIEELQNRRVEVFFFQDGIDPMPGATNSPPGAPEYAAWNEAVEEQRTFTPSIAGRCSLIVVTDIETDDETNAGIRFTLRSVEGAYEQTYDPATSGVPVNDYFELAFSGIPRASFLTLVASYPSGDEQVVFSDIPYDEIRRVGRAGPNDIVDPFTMEPPL